MHISMNKFLPTKEKSINVHFRNKKSWRVQKVCKEKER